MCEPRHGGNPEWSQTPHAGCLQSYHRLHRRQVGPLTYHRQYPRQVGSAVARYR